MRRLPRQAPLFERKLMYCEKCGSLFEEARRCPECRSRRVREAREGDPCFLIEQNAVWSELLSDVLTQEKIPFLRKSSLGAGLTAEIGKMLETVRFLVPYEFLSQAREITEGLFSDHAEIVEEDNENGIE